MAFTASPSVLSHICNFNQTPHDPKTKKLKNWTIFRDIKQRQQPGQHIHTNPNLSVKCSINEGAPLDHIPQNDGKYSQKEEQSEGFWSRWKMNSDEMRSKIAKLGLAAVLAYGLFDGVTYTSFFVMAFYGYEKTTGKNPAANLQALLGIVILMWTGNNVTRPFRVAGAAALAPLIDKGLKKIQRYFNFPNIVYAFALVASIVAGSCLTVVGFLILSRWGK